MIRRSQGMLREDVNGEWLYKRLAEALANDGDSAQVRNKRASELLQQHGIPGLRYLDGSSRADGEGTYNFVIWDESRLGPDVAKIGTTYQLRPVERAYGGRAAYDAAKAAGKTKLSYGQWLSVRTPEFKAWFGDWEGLRAQQKLDAMEPVSVPVPDEWRGLPIEALRKEALAKLKKLVGDKRKGKGFTDIEHPELGTIRVDSRGVRKTKDASADPAKLIVAAHVDSILPQAIYSRSELPEEGSNKPNTEGVSKLLARVDVDGVELVALFTILREPDGSWYYNTVMVHDLKSPEGEAGGLTTEYNQQKAEERAAPLTSLREHVRAPLRRVKPESVSQAVDPDTGEPLVFYHGGEGDFSQVVDKGRFGQMVFVLEGEPSDYRSATYPLFVRGKILEAGELAEALEGERGEALLRKHLRGREVTEEALGEIADAVREEKLYPDESAWDALGAIDEADAQVEYQALLGNVARELGYQAVRIADEFEGQTVAVVEPTAVKSATGNRGSFDGANPDITYQLRDARRVAAKRQVYEATGVPQSIFDEIEARLERVRARQLQEREGRLRLSPAAQAAGAAADESGLITRAARGALDRWAEPVVRRLEKINPVLGAQLRRFEFTTNRERAKGLGRVKGFTDGLRELAARGAQYRGPVDQARAAAVAQAQASGLAGTEAELLAGLGGISGDDYVELDLALKNRDGVRRDAILEQYGLSGAWAQVEQLLADYNKRLREAGFEFGWLADYFPRKVTDLSGLLAYLESSEAAVKTALDEAIAAVIKERGEGESQGSGEAAVVREERADEVARGILEGRIRLPDNLLKRVLVQVTEGMNRFYASPAEALSHYIEQASEALSAAALFGEHAQHGARADEAGSIGDVPLDEIGDLFGMRLGPSVEAYAQGLVATGAVSESQAGQVRQILRARFNRTKSAWRGMQAGKNVTLLMTLGHVTTTLTQIGDLAFSLYEAGFYNTVSALAKVGGKKERAVRMGAVTKEQLGIDQIAEGFKDASKLSKAVDWVFKVTGFEHMDRVGKEAIMTAKLSQLQQEALRGRLNPKAQAMLEASFAPAAHAKILEDLGRGERSEDTLFLAYSTLANFQPISLSEYPQAYLNHPNGRLFYLLKTFTLKAISALRREGFSKIVHGKTVAEKAAGFRNLIWLAGLMYLIGVPTDALKDIIMGRGVRLDDLHVDNLLKLVGINRWITWRMRDGHVFQATRAVVGPPTPWLDYPMSDWEKMQKQQAKGLSTGLSDLETWKLVPIVGRPWYWYVGGGREKLRRQAERREQKRARKHRPKKHWESI